MLLHGSTGWAAVAAAPSESRRQHAVQDLDDDSDRSRAAPTRSECHTAASRKTGMLDLPDIDIAVPLHEVYLNAGLADAAEA